MDIKLVTETILVTEAMRLLGTGFKGITGNKYSGIDWVSEPTFSKEEFDAKIIELQAEYDALKYQRDRADSYPSLQDVTVAMAEKLEGNSQMWDTITAQRLDVKSEFPKP